MLYVCYFWHAIWFISWDGLDLSDWTFSALSDLIETSKEEVLFLLLSFCEITEAKVQGSNFSGSTSGEVCSKIQSFMREAICYWIGVINDIVHGDPSSSHIHETELALLWGVISCYPHMIDIPEISSYLIDLIDALDQLLMIEAGMTPSLSFGFYLLPTLNPGINFPGLLSNYSIICFFWFFV